MEGIKKLKRAVLKQLDCDKNEIMTTLEDVANHGANSGFNGFIYYNETAGFYKKHRKLILNQLAQDAEGAEKNLLELVKSFNCIKNLDVSDIEIMEVLVGKVKTDTHILIANCLAWYTLEAVAYYVTDQEAVRV